MLTVCVNVKLVDEFFEAIKTFDVKDPVIAVKFLGIKITYETAFSYSMSQHTIILHLIEQFGLKNAKPVGTPVTEIVFSAGHGFVVRSKSIIISYIDFYGLSGTHARIGFAVHRMTCRTHAPRMCDFKMGKRILHYLAGTSDYRLDVAKLMAARVYISNCIPMSIGPVKAVTANQ
jgi:hypothetical protein